MTISSTQFISQVQIAVGSSSLKIIALTVRAHFYVNPGKNIRNWYNWFSVLTNLKDKVKIIYWRRQITLNIFTMFLFFVRPCWALKVPLQDRLITDIIEMNKVQFDLKSYAWFQNRTGTQCKFHLKSRVWFQTKIVRHRVQLPLYYIHFQWKRKIQSLKYRIFQ